MDTDSRLTGRKGWRQFSGLLSQIQSWGENRDGVLGIAVYGSVARGDVDPYSDIDLVVVTKSADQVAEVEKELVESWESVFDFTKADKRIVFLKHPFVKIEFAVVTAGQHGQVDRLFIESRIPNPSRAILVDKSGALFDALSSWSHTSEREPNAFEQEGRSFLYYYNGFHAPFARGDLYRAFFQYSLAFFKLATLLYLAQGGRDYLYTPKFLMHSLKREDADRLRDASPIFDPLKMRDGTERMFDLFLELVNRCSKTDAFPPSAMARLRARILAHHPRFWGLRDLGAIEGVRPGVLLRSARLDRYSEEEISEWVKAVGLRTLIDLRTDEEMLEQGYGYPETVLERVDYLRLPVTTKLSDTPDQNSPTPQSAMERYYAELPEERSFKEAMQQVAEVLEDRTRLPALVHCRGGTDRTGVIVAVVLLALGVEKRAILADYLLSYGHTKPEYMQRLFDSVEASGGLKEYLARVGVSPERLVAVRANLLDPCGEERLSPESDR